MDTDVSNPSRPTVKYFHSYSSIQIYVMSARQEYDVIVIGAGTSKSSITDTIR